MNAERFPQVPVCFQPVAFEFSSLHSYIVLECLKLTYLLCMTAACVQSRIGKHILADEGILLFFVEG